MIYRFDIIAAGAIAKLNECLFSVNTHALLQQANRV